jgi:hypothetical protein
MDRAVRYLPLLLSSRHAQTLNERQALEREREELPGQIAAYRRELDATPFEDKERREGLEWRNRRIEKRKAELRARLEARA